MASLEETFAQLAENEQDFYGEALTNKRGSSPSSSVITNVPSEASQVAPNKTQIVIEKPAPKTPAAEQKPVEDPYDIAFNSVKEMSAKISASQNYEERHRLMMDLRTSTMNVLEQAHTAAQAQSEKVFNLPLMRDQYQFALKKVQQFPEFQGQLVAFEKRLQQAEMRAQDMTKNIVKSNPKLQTLVKTVDGELEIQTKTTEAMWARQQKNLDRAELQKEAAADRLGMVDPNVRATLVAQFPGLNDDVALAKWLDKDGHGKDWLPIIQGTMPAESYLTEALKGNRPARMMAMLEQKKRTGQPEQVIAGDMKDAERFVQDPSFMLSEMTRYKIGTPEAVQNLAGKIKLEQSKADVESRMKMAIGNVDVYLRKKNEERIDTNLQSWPQVPGQPSLLSTPEAAATYKRLEQTLGSAPNITTFAKSFIKDAKTNEEKIARQALVSEAYSSAMASYGNGVFHVPFSPGFIADKNRGLKTASTWAAVRSPQQLGADVRSGKFFSDLATSAYEGITSLQGAGGIGAGNGAESLDAFLNGLVSGGKK
jgi:hypothetical protein